MTNISRIRSCYHLWQNNIHPDKIASDLGVHRATIYRWIYKMRTKGFHKMLQHYINAKKRSREKTPGWIKALVCDIRNNNHQVCGQKIVWELKKHSVKLSLATVYRILTARGLVTKHYKGKKYLGRSEQGKTAGDIVQADTVMLGELVAFTFVDTLTRQPVVRIANNLTSLAGRKALKVALEQIGPINTLQSDGGPEFKRYFRKLAEAKCKVVRVSRPYRKNDQSYIESFNRTLRKECVGWTLYKKEQKEELQTKVNAFLWRYMNDRPHLGLNMMTPHEFALSHLT